MYSFSDWVRKSGDIWWASPGHRSVSFFSFTSRLHSRNETQVDISTNSQNHGVVALFKCVVYCDISNAADTWFVFPH